MLDIFSRFGGVHDYAPETLRMGALLSCCNSAFGLVFFTDEQMTKHILTPPSPWFETSWIVGGLALIAGVVGGVLAFSFGVVAFRIGLYVSAALSVGWVGTLTAALAIHRARGLWLLVVSPAALFWPVAVGCFIWAFRTG